ncbi:uncharacterized protein LOC108028105 [Drosophila biarmipes]|uniref:uncharacterized protein LOC108028105 n=1 Tax=Drosophila biarmipes TaxID=125945 RepID=UPI001CDB34C8|nr:uncharacterized protein LOC108028105 [Drosophila biarmipes]
MEWFVKLLIYFQIACLGLSEVYGMHNPMMRIHCDLGELLTCKFKFVHCWLYECVCLPEHIYLGLGNGCLYIEFA